MRCREESRLVLRSVLRNSCEVLVIVGWFWVGAFSTDMFEA